MAPFLLPDIGSQSLNPNPGWAIQEWSILGETQGDPLSLCGTERRASTSEMYILSEYKQEPKLTDGPENISQSLKVTHMV